MTPTQAKAYMAELSQVALANRSEMITLKVVRGNLTFTVSARANRIGFVYWYFDGKPLPRKRLQGLLEEPAVKSKT